MTCMKHKKIIRGNFIGELALSNPELVCVFERRQECFSLIFPQDHGRLHQASTHTVYPEREMEHELRLAQQWWQVRPA